MDSRIKTPSPTGVRDITGQHATAALRESEELFRIAFEHAPVGMLLTGPDATMLRVNQALCAMLGYTAAELLAASAWSFTHPEDVEPNRTFMRRALAGEIDTYEVEKRYLRKDGQIVWGHLRGSLVRDAAGEPRCFVSQIQDITARKAAEAELAATHQQTHQVLERITDGFYALDREWRFTYLNAAAEQMLERSRDDVLGEVVWDAFAATVATPLYAAYHQAMQEGITTSVDLFYPPLAAWYEVRAYPTPHGLSVFFRDVTRSRALTEELQISEARFRTLVEQLPAAVYLLADDANETPLYFSPYIEVLTGETPEEAMATHARWLDLVHPADRARVATEDERVGVSTEAFHAEYRHQRKDGSFVWIQDEFVPVKDETGQVVAWLGVMLDITHRIDAEEAQARLAAIVASAEDAIISSALDATITSWNSGAEKLYGYRAEEVLGRPFRVLLPEERDDPLLEGRVAAARAGAPVEAFETRRRRADGSCVDVTMALSPIRDRAGSVIGLSSITRDITAQKQAEADLAAALAAAEEANQAKSHYLAMMSHELRTPLQAVLGYTEFLLADPAGTFTVEQREDLTYIEQGGRRMLTLINHLLDLSRIEAGRLDVVRSAVDLASVLEQVRQDVAPQVLHNGIALQIALPAALPPVLGDPDRLRQILLNLVGNAVKFTEQGSVDITASTTTAGVAVVVRDTGSGIAPEALPHIFEMFHQARADSRLSRRHGGSGLGLTISRKLAELMDGEITVESVLGKGSTFTLTMPAALPNPG